jgi:hypothetical protein
MCCSAFRALPRWADDVQAGMSLTLLRKGDPRRPDDLSGSPRKSTSVLAAGQIQFPPLDSSAPLLALAAAISSLSFVTQESKKLSNFLFREQMYTQK